MRFDILKCLGVDHRIDEQTDKTAYSNSAVQQRALKIAINDVR